MELVTIKELETKYDLKYGTVRYKLDKANIESIVKVVDNRIVLHYPAAESFTALEFIKPKKTLKAE